MDNKKQALCLDQLPHYTELLKAYINSATSTDINGTYSERKTCTFNEQGTLAIACVSLPAHVKEENISLISVMSQGGTTDYRNYFEIQTSSDELGFIIACSDLSIIKKTIGRSLNVRFSISNASYNGNFSGAYSARNVCDFNEQGDKAISSVQLPVHVSKDRIALTSVTVQGGSINYKDNYEINTNNDELGFMISCSDIGVLKKCIGKILNIKFTISE